MIIRILDKMKLLCKNVYTLSLALVQWFLYSIRTMWPSKEFIQQVAIKVISGAIIALVSFWSAYGLYIIQERSKTNTIQLDSFIKIQNEVSENRVILENEIERKKKGSFSPALWLPLRTSAWQTGKYQTSVETPLLLDGLRNLYDDIERYNHIVNTLRFQVLEKRLLAENAPDDMKIVLITYLRKFEKLTVREAVLLGLTTREEFEKQFGRWEDNIKMPYFQE